MPPVEAFRYLRLYLCIKILNMENRVTTFQSDTAEGLEQMVNRFIEGLDVITISYTMAWDNGGDGVSPHMLHSVMVLYRA